MKQDWDGSWGSRDIGSWDRLGTGCWGLGSGPRASGSGARGSGSGTGDTGGESGDARGGAGDARGEAGDAGGGAGDAGGEAQDTGGDARDIGGDARGTGGEARDTGAVTRATGGGARRAGRVMGVRAEFPERWARSERCSRSPSSLTRNRVRNSRVRSGSRPAASAPFEGWSNARRNSTEKVARSEESCGLRSKAAMAQSRAWSASDDTMSATLAPSERNQEGWQRMKAWHSSR